MEVNESKKSDQVNNIMDSVVHETMKIDRRNHFVNSMVDKQIKYDRINKNLHRSELLFLLLYKKNET